MNKKILLSLFAALALQSSAQTRYTNPVIHGDVPDPSIIRIDDTYYAAGTSSEWAPFYPVFKSKDLINWTQTGHIFDKQPEWTSNSFWAPELFYHNNKVYCYYTARQKSTGISYIGVAIADSPTSTFTDHGPIIEYGTEAIDAFVYDDGGQLYISWKAYGLDARPIELLGSKLSADGLHLEGEPFTLLVDDENIGMEGQYHFKHGDYYYIVYAARGCCGPESDYDVRVARAKSYRGPYEKYSGNPILHGSKDGIQSCGHGTAVETPDGRMFYMCHAYMRGNDFYCGRQPVLHEMVMTDDQWVAFRTGDTAQTMAEVPFAGTLQNHLVHFEDHFHSDKLDVRWTWNYPYADINATTGEKGLTLSGMMKKDYVHGTALCLRPQSAHYVCETKVINTNNSIKGLTLYGDDQNLITWGVQGDRLQLRIIKNNKETIAYTSSWTARNTYLRIEVVDGHQFRFYMSSNGKQWDRVKENRLNGESLIRWDRVQRPGLIHNGSNDEPAVFAYFIMRNF